MKRLFVLAVLVAAPSFAQETYSVNTTTAANTALHERNRAAANRQTCTRLGQSLTCTQAQACTAAGAAGGASCTAAQARAANARIYPATLAGREEFLVFDMVLPEFNRRVKGAAADEQNAAKAWFLAQNQTVRDAECSKWGVAAGCNPYE